MHTLTHSFSISLLACARRVLHYLIQLGVLLYVIVYVIIIKKGYQGSGDLVGTATTKVRCFSLSLLPLPLSLSSCHLRRCSCHSLLCFPRETLFLLPRSLSPSFRRKETVGILIPLQARRSGMLTIRVRHATELEWHSFSSSFDLRSSSRTRSFIFCLVFLDPLFLPLFCV